MSQELSDQWTSKLRTKEYIMCQLIQQPLAKQYCNVPLCKQYLMIITDDNIVIILVQDLLMVDLLLAEKTSW